MHELCEYDITKLEQQRLIKYFCKETDNVVKIDSEFAHSSDSVIQ